MCQCCSVRGPPLCLDIINTVPQYVHHTERQVSIFPPLHSGVSLAEIPKEHKFSISVHKTILPQAAATVTSHGWLWSFVVVGRQC